MEEEFEKKSKKKILKIVIPIIIILLVVGAGLAYYFVSNTPKNIFTKSVDKLLNSEEGEKYETLRTNIELSASIESDNSEIQSIGQILNRIKLNSNQEIDLNNKVLNEAITLNYSGEDLLNLECIINEESTYIFLKELFDKYIEIPLDEMGIEDIFSSVQKIEEIDDKEILSEFSKIIKNELKEKTYKQEKEKVVIDGKKVNATVSKLVLTSEDLKNITISFANNIITNDKIMSMFNNKEEITKTIQELINSLNEMPTSEEDGMLEILIYTKGIFNKEIVRFEANIISDELNAGVYIAKTSNNKYVFAVLEDATELFSVSILNEKENENSGTITIELDLSDIMEQAGMDIGQLTLAIKLKYNVEYNAKVEIPDFTDSVEIDSMTEEEINKIDENAQKVMTKLGEILLQTGLVDASDLYDGKSMLNNTKEDEELLMNPETITSGNTEPEVTYGNYTVKYNVPEEFTSSSYNTSDYKYYVDKKFNNVTVTIEKETKSNYLELLKEEYALTPGLYENQEISGIKTLTIGDKEFSYRTITYSMDEYNYTSFYYCYELGDGYLYIVEAETEDGTVLETDLTKFLEIQL